LGDWERARDQLKALAELDAGSFPLVHLYGAAINCELLRRDVFAGARTPVMLGEPLPWVALLLQALAAEAQGKDGDAKTLRGEALEQAKAVPGTVDGQAFEWIADADFAPGPICEAVIDGQYYWVPYERIRSIAWRHRRICVIFSGCRLSSVSSTGAIPRPCFPPDTRLGVEHRRIDPAWAKDRVEGGGAGNVSRTRPTHAHHRRGGVSTPECSAH
jgi:hypothetical protein